MEKDTHEEEAELELEATGEDNIVEPELEDTEALTSSKLKDVREKLKACEAAKMTALEELQRTKADFLNARKRLEERLLDRERAVKQHIEALIPLYDSFAMAMSNQAAWEAVDKNWRIGVESIFAQLQALLTSYGTIVDAPTGKPFDPTQHEALSEEPTKDEAAHHTIVRVVQVGFKRKAGEHETIIRPARVIVGAYHP